MNKHWGCRGGAKYTTWKQGGFWGWQKAWGRRQKYSWKLRLIYSNDWQKGFNSYLKVDVPISLAVGAAFVEEVQVLDKQAEERDHHLQTHNNQNNAMWKRTPVARFLPPIIYLEVIHWLPHHATPPVWETGLFFFFSKYCLQTFLSFFRDTLWHKVGLKLSSWKSE